MSFGRIIAAARKQRGLSLKEVATQLRKEDGAAISPQYLNDIEHDRRHPPSEHLLHQLARVLNLSTDYLLYKAHELPSDLPDADPARVDEAFAAFRRVIKGREKPQ